MNCPKCQTKNPANAKFCMECGLDLVKIVADPPIDYSQAQSYTPKFLIDKILTTRSSIEGERKSVTILFADVSGFTSISERFDPEQVHQIMDGCFKILMNEIHKHQGTINQFTGDGVMALFGAPLALEDHAPNACRAALAIQEANNAYQKEIRREFGLDFQIRIGINSGEVVVGAIGDDLRMDYTAVGDTTNLAARMESMARPGTVLVSPYTYEKVHQQFAFKSQGEVRIKGKEKSLEVYTLVKESVSRPRLGLERQIYSEMVGRDRELDRLELQVMKAVNNEGSVVNIIGEAGIGKSRLMAELKTREVMKKVALLEGRAISIGRNFSFHPIIDLLKHWTGIKEKDTESRAFSRLETAIRAVCSQESREDTDEILSFVAILLGMKLSGKYAQRVEGIEGEALEKLLLKNIKDLLTQASNQSPLVIVMEDLHWADLSSIEMLESLFRMVEMLPILFINVFRPEYQETGERIVATIKEKLDLYYVEINLNPLDNQMSEILIYNMLNIKGLPYAVKDKIIQRSGGNPFFIEEVVRTFIDNQAIIVKGGKFEVTDKIETMVIPHTINDVLMARIDQLEEDTRNLVRVASVIGRHFFHKILAQVAGTVDDIDDRLSYLKEIQLIRERKRMEELEYFFKHALAQEAAYESILLQKRKELHLKVAQSVEEIFQERLHEFYGMLALHYSKAEDYEKAEYYLVKAGEEAIRTSASNEALNYYQEGLNLFLKHSKDASDPEKRAMFEKNIAIALHNKCHWAEAVERIDKTLECWRIPTYPNRILILVKFAVNAISIMAGQDRWFNRKKPAPDRRERDILLLSFKKGQALSYFDASKMLFTCLSNFNKSFKVDITKSPEAINSVFWLATAFLASGFLFRFSEKLLALCEAKMDKKNSQNFIHYTITYIYLKHYSGNFKELGSVWKPIVDDGFKKGEMVDVVASLTLVAWTRALMGDFEEPDLLAAHLFKAADTFDYPNARANANAIKTFSLLTRAQLFDVLPEMEECSILCKQYGMEHGYLNLLGLKAEAHLLLNNLKEAEESLREADEMTNQGISIVPIFISSSKVARFLMDIQRLKKVMHSADHSHVPGLRKQARKSGKSALGISKRYPPVRPKVFRLMGEYYWSMGKQKKAFKWWKKAIKKGEEMGARPELSRTFFEVGKRLRDPNCKYSSLNHISAGEYLEKARFLFTEMGLQRDLEVLEEFKSQSFEIS